MGPYQRTPKWVTSAITYSGLGVRSVGPVGDFLDTSIIHNQPAPNPREHTKSYRNQLGICPEEWHRYRPEKQLAIFGIYLVDKNN